MIVKRDCPGGPAIGKVEKEKITGGGYERSTLYICMKIA
jgi:hypothetical protein